LTWKQSLQGREVQTSSLGSNRIDTWSLNREYKWKSSCVWNALWRRYEGAHSSDWTSRKWNCSDMNTFGGEAMSGTRSRTRCLDL
jgi:hypothetical protein